MPNLNKLVLTGADYKVLIDVPNAAGGFTAYPILTGDTLDYDIAVEDETIHAIGNRLPIAEKSNAKSYGGTFSLQMGELNVLVQAAGLNDATDLQGCTLAVTAIQGGFARVFTSVNFNGEKMSIKRKDKETIVTLPWKGLGVNLE